MFLKNDALSWWIEQSLARS